jgi:hypothetical protein
MTLSTVDLVDTGSFDKAIFSFHHAWEDLCVVSSTYEKHALGL